MIPGATRRTRNGGRWGGSWRNGFPLPADGLASSAAVVSGGETHRRRGGEIGDGMAAAAHEVGDHVFGLGVLGHQGVLGGVGLFEQEQNQGAVPVGPGGRVRPKDSESGAIIQVGFCSRREAVLAMFFLRLEEVKV